MDNSDKNKIKIMACTQTLKGIDIACEGATGGVKEVYIANFDDVVKPTILADKISTIALTEPGTKFKTYKFRKNTASMVSTANFNDENGTHYVSTDLSLKFSKMETSKRLEIQSLFVGQCSIIVLTQDDTYWYLGMDNPVTMTAGTAETGTQMTDLNGYTITLQDLSKAFPYEIDKEWMGTNKDTIIEAAPTNGAGE